MSNGYALDTNVASRLMASDPAARARAAQAGIIIYIPSIVFGELYFGILRLGPTRKATAFQLELDRPRNSYLSLPCDLQTAEIYGRIRAQLESAGQRIPLNDFWIAATAI